MQATPVIEFARDKGGKIKWSFGDRVTEQPIPRKMRDWFFGNETRAINCLAESCKNDADEIDKAKLDHMVKGLESLLLGGNKVKKSFNIATKLLNTLS